MNIYIWWCFLQMVFVVMLVVVGGLLEGVCVQQLVVMLCCLLLMLVDQNVVYYVWYECFVVNLKVSVGDVIWVDYFLNSQFGKENDVVQQVKIGVIDMMILGLLIWVMIVLEFGMFDFGYLFDSYVYVVKVFDGQVGMSLNVLL